jgi:hypothetical protein
MAEILTPVTKINHQKLRCLILHSVLTPMPISMEKNNMYFDTRKAKIFKDLYKPTPNLSRFIKSLFTVVVSGQSLLGTPAVYKRKFH